MRALMANYHIPFWQFGDVWLDRIDMTEAELDEAVRRFYTDVFGKAAAKQGARRWGDKTPFHVHHMRRAGRIFPDAQFVATVRHPGAVANSMKRFGWSWKAGIRTWLNSNQAMIDSGIELGDRMYLIRYEDLVSDTEAVMREVLDFLGEPWDDRVLSHHEEKSGRAEGGTKADEPVDTARIARWTESVSNEQMRRLVSRTQGLAPAFGYDPADPMPVAALNDRSDSIGMTGSVHILHHVVVLRPGILVGDAEGQRTAGRLSLPEAAQPFYLIGFPSGRGQLGLSGLSSAQFECNSLCVDFDSGGHSVDDPTDRVSM